MSRVLFSLALALVVGLGPSGAAWAQGAEPTSETEFKAHLDRGMAAYKAGDYATALVAFEQAWATKEAPALLYNIGRCYERLGDGDRALETYERLLAAAGTTAELRAKALESVAALKREQAARVAAARVPAPSTATPGEGPASLEASPVAATPRSRALEWTLIGGGAVAAAVGASFGVLALVAEGKFEDATAREDKVRYKDEADRDALIADIGLGVGALAVASGVVLFFVRDDDESIALAPSWLGDGAGLAAVGRF
jgi:Tfp pilus assembly protein PilF